MEQWEYLIVPQMTAFAVYDVHDQGINGFLS
jgi:hypothetical protein